MIECVTCSGPSRGRRCRRCYEHGQAKVLTGAYRSWKAMRERCICETNSAYPKYGGRGISVCSRWDSFQAFYEDMGDRPEGHSIDRIDNDGNYEPDNCRWATYSEQNINKRRWG